MPELERAPAGPAGCLLRLVWMLLGNFVLAIVLIAIAQDMGDGWFSWLDALFWLVVAATIAARFADIAYFQGRTADNQPANLGHWRRYALWVLAIAAAAWVGAHLL